MDNKIFFNIMSQQIILLSTTNINTSVQKCGIAGIPGCLEHISMIMQLQKEAKEGKSCLVVLWLDFTNAMDWFNIN